MQTNPDLVKKFKIKSLPTYFAGNIDSLGGLSPMTETVGQDKLLGEAAGAQLRGMVSSITAVVRKIFQAIAWYEWNDPVRQRTIEKPIPDTDLKIPIRWGKRGRGGNFSDFDFDIDVYSLQDNSPGLKLQKLGAVMQQYVLPLAPMIQQQGGSIDAQSILELVAKYADLPELSGIVQFLQSGEGTAQSESPEMPQNTTRMYERVNRPGATNGGKSQILQAALLGGRPQQSEMDAVGRVTG